MLQINIRSLYSNKDLIQHYALSNNIDIIILSETWTNPNNLLNFNNYNLITLDRQDGFGGVGFLIHKKFSWEIIDPNFNYIRFQVLKINIKFKNIDLNIISFYNNSINRPQEIINEFDYLISHNSHNCIIAGDINIHNALWNFSLSATHNTTGDKIAEIITNNDVCLLNNGSHTRQDLYRNSSSAIDITLCSSNLFEKLSWNVDSTNLKSDHLSILIDYKINYYQKKQITNWSMVLKGFNLSNINEDFNIEGYLEDLISKNTSTVIHKNNFKPKPWWNDLIQRLWNIKKQKQQIYNANKNLFTALELKKSVQKLKLTIKKEKKNPGIFF